MVTSLRNQYLHRTKVIFFNNFFILHSVTNFFFIETNNTDHEIGITHQLSHEMHASLLAMARRLRPHKAKADFNRLKQQREEKRKKGELLLILQERKVCEEHADKLYLRNLCANNECWKSEAEAQEGISNMSGVTVAKESLKHVITIYVKGLG